MSSDPSDPDAPMPVRPRTPVDWLHALGEATAFFTCLPLDGRVARFRAADILPVWPVVGLAVGLAAGIDLAIAQWLGAAPWLAAVIALLTGAVLTCALHEDGLADTMDALGAATADRERRLEILRDSRIGTFGALALGFSLLLRVMAITQISAVEGSGAALLALMAVHALSRAAIVWPLLNSGPARSDGLGAAVGKPAAANAGLALGIGAVVAILCLVGINPLAALLVAPVGVALAMGVSAVARASFGGYTGDTLGATQQVVEIGLLALIAMCIGGGS